MAVKIKLARTPKQIDEALKVRYQVFCQEDVKLCPQEGDRIFDRFDTYNTTYHLVVIFDEVVVGTMRMTLDSDVGVPADEFYDFRAHLPEEYNLLSAGMYCVSRPFRQQNIALGLIQMSVYFSVQHNITHIVAPVNPDIVNLIKRVGFKAISDEIIDVHSGLPIIPVLLNINDVKDFFMNFAHQNQMYNFINSYEYLTYDEGEYIIYAGDVGDEAFVIVSGIVSIRFPGTEKVIYDMSEGDVFGELALFTNTTRSADVVAKTKVRIMALPKSAFLVHLRNNPDKAIEFMRSIGNRLNTLTKNYPGL
ncbi:MAG: GNAT family N-acetyltransferase [Spirulina sp. SIO3F2]|nr:GNAT family N-acetyltransferase [Spirulina sp. SIO3F2]